MSAQYLGYLDVVSPNFVKTFITKKQRELYFTWPLGSKSTSVYAKFRAENFGSSDAYPFPLKMSAIIVFHRDLLHGGYGETVERVKQIYCLY